MAALKGKLVYLIQLKAYCLDLRLRWLLDAAAAAAAAAAASWVVALLCDVGGKVGVRWEWWAAWAATGQAGREEPR